MRRTQRFERRLAEARTDAREVLMTYKHEIEIQRARQMASRNGFIKTCCQQEIDQLTAEMNAIDMEVVG